LAAPVGAAKRLAVSTGRLRRLPAVHLRPIDPVVFREPVALRPGGLVLGWVSRLDALPLSITLGTLADGLGFFPLDYES